MMIVLSNENRRPRKIVFGCDLKQQLVIQPSWKEDKRPAGQRKAPVGALPYGSWLARGHRIHGLFRLRAARHLTHFVG
jgi:hypothetical protein